MINNGKKRLRVFTWHIHGSYLYYLSQGDYDIYIPLNGKNTEGYYGRGKTFPFGKNVIEVPAAEIKKTVFDCILFQTNKNFLEDQYEILSEEQRQLPRVYVEHDPPWESPTEATHIMDDPETILVHVTHFNRLMWHSTVKHVRVIEHGVMPGPNLYSGDIERGITVINHMHQRGRRLGADIYDQVAGQVPLDLAGMGTEGYGGFGEILHPDLAKFISHYRFFFNPIRYTSLGLALCEAMMQGMPVVALATTEYVTVIEDGVSGFIDTDVDYLVDKMKYLLHNRGEAKRMGREAKRIAEQRFGINRFVSEWKKTFEHAIQLKTKQHEENYSIY
jgi:glycosyltransferase involved in cell wall biosynthesis